MPLAAEVYAITAEPPALRSGTGTAADGGASPEAPLVSEGPSFSLPAEASACACLPVLWQAGPPVLRQTGPHADRSAQAGVPRSSLSVSEASLVSEGPAFSVSASVLSPESSALSSQASLTTDHASPELALSTQSSALGDHHELVFIESSIQDPEQLAVGITPGAEVVWLDDNRDGIEQISAALTRRHDLDAVHFVTHGSERVVKLGTAWLSQETLATYTDQIAGWQTSLADGADLLFYACDLASSDAGQTLLESIHHLTGADIAASTNDTGHEQYGADWDLEYQLGAIETGPLLSQSVQDTWTGLFATFTVTNTFDLFQDSELGPLVAPGSLRAAIEAANDNPGLDTINFTIPGAGVKTITIVNLFNVFTNSFTGPLPAITDPVIIDGTTQPGYAGTPLIELNLNPA